MRKYHDPKFNVGDVLRHKAIKNYHKLQIVKADNFYYSFKFLDSEKIVLNNNIGSDDKELVEDEWILDIKPYNKIWRQLNEI